MPFKPLEKMWESIEVARGDSDVALFFELLYLGEMLTKTIAAGLVASIADDRDRHRYRQLHRLVRADSLGEWSSAIDDLLTGPAAQFVLPEAREVHGELTQVCGPGVWQYDSVALLNTCVKILDPLSEAMPPRVSGRRLFTTFVALRNKTRGHGATQGDSCSRMSPDLERALRLVIDNFNLFRCPWAYLHRNLSGKYRVTSLSNDSGAFEPLKKSTSVNLLDGVYVHFGESARVGLIESTVDAVDFFFPNGGFNGKHFELISYISDSKKTADAAPYLAPAGELPPSNTEGLGILDVQGQIFGNLPPMPEGYIHRHDLEEELYSALADDRHPIVTLDGRGGIGKTSLALSVLHRMTAGDRFTAVLWFSGRDIDLLPEGPKVVRPQVATEKDIAREFVVLVQPREAGARGFDSLRYLEASLTGSTIGPLLFVFDNFETVRAPLELFRRLDTYVRSPNKILITTRVRTFKADYPIEVLGMTEAEFGELIDRTATTLGIAGLLSRDYRQELYRESDGHPYVGKILLGEVAKAGRTVKVERIVASKEGILDALFERTFSGLSPVAKRIFLALCHWPSTVPQIAVEAALLRADPERIDVEKAVEELRQASFVEVRQSSKDRETFLSVPVVTAIFGRRKLAASPIRSAVEVDTEFLYAFGAAQQSDIRHGVGPRIDRLFRHVAGRISRHEVELDSVIPTLEFVAGRYPHAWLLLASLHEESGREDIPERAVEAVRRFLESGVAGEERRLAWERLADLSSRTGDSLTEAQALVELSGFPNSPLYVMSNAANRLNGLFSRRQLSLDTYEKQLLVRRLVEALEMRIQEGDATDCSRLAWLSLHLGDEDRARRFTGMGLRLDRDNEHCGKLAMKLRMW